MQQSKIFKLLAIISILMTIVFPFTSQDVLAREDSLPPQEDATVLRLNLLPMEEANSNLWVVRVYFENRQQIEEIAAWTEPWEVNN